MTSQSLAASWVKYVRLLNLLTALIQLLAGVGSLTEIFSLDVPATFIAVYVMFFALLLLAFECRWRATDAFLRQNFGFLYTFRGLGAYLLFIGLLDFGMAGGLFGYIAGASACFTAFVVLTTSMCTNATPAGASALNSERLPTYGSSTFTSPTATKLADPSYPTATTTTTSAAPVTAPPAPAPASKKSKGK